MDPLQALCDAQAHLKAGDLAEALACLKAYRQWRAAGGFEPAGGDGLALLLEQQLGEYAGSRQSKDDEPRLLADCLDELAEQRTWPREWRRRRGGNA